MWNVFQQPWTLTAAAILTLFMVLTLRSAWPEKHRIWHFLLPIAVAAVAFGLDHVVQTDIERVHRTLSDVIAAVENEDYPGIDACLAPDYRDSFHSDKAAIMAQAHRQLGRSGVRETRRIATSVRLDNDIAVALLTVVLRFEPNSYVAQTYRGAVVLKMRIYFAQQPDGRWLISTSELLEIDRQPTSWRQI